MRPATEALPAESVGPGGEVTDASTSDFLRRFMQEFRTHTERVLTVLPRR